VRVRQLIRLRRTIQTLGLLFFLFLLIVSRLPQDIYQDYSLAFSTETDLRLEQPVTFFFQLDPLVVISSLLSGVTLIKGFLWAAGLVLVTLALGRVFCGFVCPFGSIHHAIGAVKPALKGNGCFRPTGRPPASVSNILS
jgi:polyferredoxin